MATTFVLPESRAPLFNLGEAAVVETISGTKLGAAGQHFSVLDGLARSARTTLHREREPSLDREREASQSLRQGA
jgi:hypothetical protein